MTGNYNKMSLEVAIYIFPKLFLSYSNTVEDGDCNKATWYERPARNCWGPNKQATYLEAKHLLPTHTPLKSLIKRSFIKDEINSTKLFKEPYCWAGKVSQLYYWVPATKPYSPELTWWKENTDSHKFSSDPSLQVLNGMGMWVHTYTFFKV